MVETGTPRVWVGCLACYNAGALIGEWFDATDAPCEMEAFGQAVVHPAGMAHEELWVFDHEGFHGLLSGECSPMEAQRIAEALARVDEPAAFAAWFVDTYGSGIACPDDEALDAFTDAYCGEYASETDFAQELAEELGTVPTNYSWPASYIDWERAARDLFMSDYASSDTADYGVYVWRVQ
jgi:antirestriction protein